VAVTGAQIVAAVEKFAGYPYVYGGDTPSGFDCSGLVQYVLTSLGIKGVPRTSEEQFAWATPVSRNQLAPGDLVFAQFAGDNASPGHVGVYVGGGQVFSAEDPQQGIGLASLSSWGSNIVGYGAVPGTAASSAAGTTATLDSAVTGAGPLDAVSSALSSAGTLLGDAAKAMDWFFHFFKPGQGWRIAFGGAAVLATAGGIRSWQSASQSEDATAALPLAVLLFALAALASFMTLRQWPQPGGKPITPGAYAVDTLEGRPPQAGAAPASDATAIEVGLGALLALWGASKAAQGLSGIAGLIGGIIGVLTGRGGSSGGGAPPVEIPEV
jgi:hypothetical protein